MADNLDREFSTPTATSLREALAARLWPTPANGAALCNLEQERALALLTGAIAECLGRAPRGEPSRELRAIARRVLGWLLVRFVREEWSAESQHTGAEHPISVRLEVGSEAGAEVLWTRWRRRDEPPDFRVIGRRLLGARNLVAHTALPEEGWEDWTRYLGDAKSALWVAMLGERPPATFGPKENERLRQAFAFDCAAHGSSSYYLTVNADDVAEPLAHPQVIDALRQGLGLPVLFVADGPDDRFFSIGETRLRDMIKQCLKTLNDHGDH